MRERWRPAEPPKPKEYWSENDLENAFLWFTEVRQTQIEEYSEDFQDYRNLSGWKKFKDRWNFNGVSFRSRYYFKWPGYESFDYSMLPSSISLGQRWKENIYPIAQKTNRDGKERLIFVTYNHNENATEFTPGPIGDEHGITRGDTLDAIKQIELVDKKVIAALGHTHPLPEHNTVAAKQYNFPSSHALFSPADLTFITGRMLTPFWFVVSGEEAILAVNNSLTSRIDGEKEFIKEFPDIPKNAFETDGLRDIIRYMRSRYKFKDARVRDDFDLLEWNIRMAKKANLALYRGSYNRLERLA